ncbi:MAG: hypothetical protein JW839_05890 [Candidatus Lokiarchaeota archaeon]|nr:hypothetical protein [Candidatus Lokiarchaeota archaeon]
MESIEETFPAPYRMLFEVVFKAIGDAENPDINKVFSKTISELEKIDDGIDEVLWIALHFLCPTRDEVGRIAEEIIDFKNQFREQTKRLPSGITSGIIESPPLVMVLKHFQERIADFGVLSGVSEYEGRILDIISKGWPDLLVIVQSYLEGLKKAHPLAPPFDANDGLNATELVNAIYLSQYISYKDTYNERLLGASKIDKENAIARSRGDAVPFELHFLDTSPRDRLETDLKTAAPSPPPPVPAQPIYAHEQHNIVDMCAKILEIVEDVQKDVEKNIDNYGSQDVEDVRGKIYETQQRFDIIDQSLRPDYGKSKGRIKQTI